MKSKIDGVFSSRDLLSWPIFQPKLFLEILPQIIDSYPQNRPVSNRLEIRQIVHNLDVDGVAIMENVVSTEFVNKSRRDLDRLVERMPELEGLIRTKRASTGGTRDYLVHEYQSALKNYRSNDPLVFSPTYAQFLLLPEVIEVTEGYLGKNWFYQAMLATRTEAIEPIRGGFAQWHHDARCRKLNIFLLLTDVPEDGPATIVFKGSHLLLYSLARRKRNFFTDAEVEKLQKQYGWEEKVCHAPAGSLVFFDSHSLHRGRRSNHLRDAFQVHCMTKRNHLWPQEIPRELFSTLDVKAQHTLLERANLRVI